MRTLIIAAVCLFTLSACASSTLDLCPKGLANPYGDIPERHM